MTWTSGTYRPRNLFKEGATAAEPWRHGRAARRQNSAAEPGISAAEWQRLQSLVIVALHGFPEARRAVEAALEADVAANP
jgi:hypothetical protein